METATETGISYRILPETEWDRLKPIFETHQAAMPSPTVAMAAVAERGNEIVGMLILQMTLHSEPLWIKPEERGNVSWKHLLADIEKVMPPGVAYYAFAPSGHIKRFCEANKMTELPWTVFVKEIE